MKRFDYDKAREICKNEYVKYAEGGLKEDPKAISMGRLFASATGGRELGE